MIKVLYGCNGSTKLAKPCEGGLLWCGMTLQWCFDDVKYIIVWYGNEVRACESVVVMWYGAVVVVYSSGNCGGGCVSVIVVMTALCGSVDGCGDRAGITTTSLPSRLLEFSSHLFSVK